ncbi:hypothetical protein ACFL13_00265 [Patescibacteria group bacterium]
MPRKILVTTLILLFLFPKTVLAGSTPPVTTYIQTPSSPDGNNGWYVSPVEFDLTSTDLESGVKELNYRVDGGTWQKVEYADSLNLVTNPSFEASDGSSPTGLYAWGASVEDEYVTYSQDATTYLSGFETSSAKTVTTQGTWHGINNKDAFAVATPYGNMTATVWLKTDSVIETAFYKIYVVSQDEFEQITYVELLQSSALTGTNDWTKISTNFIVNNADAIGVYIDIGLTGSGTVWADAISISEAITSANTAVTVSTDNENHLLEFYAVDHANNIENTQSVSFKIDQTPPNNWYNSGAYRGLGGGAEHEVYVYTTVTDPTSGLSILTSRYQYHTSRNPGFGHFTSILGCNTDWNSDGWIDLLTSPSTPGVTETDLVTQKTDFCDSNWKVCKTVKFYAEDMAGNTSYKEFCINGPWISLEGEGNVRSDYTIDMVAEADEDNTDGLVETGQSSINFFTSSRDWYAKNTTSPEAQDYSSLFSVTTSKTDFSEDLVSEGGVYEHNGNFTVDNQSTPNDYDNNTFDQIVFIDGDLAIETNITVDETSTALFVVSGNINISKTVDTVEVGLIADGDIYTAYDISEDEATKTLNLKGIYIAEKINLQRTSQGANDNKDPSEAFTFEPKYLIQLKEFFKTSHVRWESVE